MFTIKFNGIVIGTLEDHADEHSLNLLIGRYLFGEFAIGRISNSVEQSSGWLTLKPKASLHIDYRVTFPVASPDRNIKGKPLIQYFTKEEFKTGLEITIQHKKKEYIYIESDILQQRKNFINQLKVTLFALASNRLDSLPLLPIELIKLIVFKASPRTVTMEDINKWTEVILKRDIKIVESLPERESKDITFFRPKNRNSQTTCDNFLNVSIVTLGAIAAIGSMLS
ncbi:Uncharacterised protein [Legionella steigerwaltii]|uniref:Uncharacterized protein n=1 Tax=Legionella steigerwaltii TaxID=460 RepID=A0A378LBF5_9GAMM|nr:hypothetical protein [Legionella steigerwaltii]KTD81103.1 hypothetical protein Lstg_0330 [Legionella steigerwaltii]STY23208.1 Uncharacterised protein [Legionella steigerwaltii]